MPRRRPKPDQPDLWDMTPAAAQAPAPTPLPLGERGGPPAEAWPVPVHVAWLRSWRGPWVAVGEGPGEQPCFDLLRRFAGDPHWVRREVLAEGRDPREVFGEAHEVRAVPGQAAGPAM
jgi:hypothetical protein